MTRLAKPLSKIAPHYDVIVVGSGYGGAVTASRLARAGKHVAILERGREVVTGEFPNRFPELRNEIRITGANIKTGKPDALFDIRLNEDMHIIVGCGLGGGSLINAGVALRPDNRVFEDNHWPREIRDDGTLDEGFRRADAWLSPTSHHNADKLTKYRALEAATEDTGSTIVSPPVAVSFAENKNPAGILQPACTLCGDCCSGCNVGAKNTVALNYLPDAVRHGAELFTHAHVQTVTRADENDPWTVTLSPISSNGKHEDGQQITIKAGIVVLSAGTLGSTEILLRSAGAGLKTSQTLGQRFSANGDIIAFGYGATPEINAVGIGHPPKIENFEVGPAVSGQLEIDDEQTLDNEIRVQDGVLPSAIAPILPVMFVPNGRLLGALKSLINGVYKGPFKHLQTFFAVSHDNAKGAFSLKKDRLTLSWPNAKDQPVYARLDAILDKITSNSGGSYVKNPLAGSVMGHQPATAHPLGGCAMAETHETGVVNHKCQVFNPALANGANSVHDGLYVIDGAVIPRSLGVNPLLTITALAERAMIHISDDYDLNYDCDPAGPETQTTPNAPGLPSPCSYEKVHGGHKQRSIEPTG